MTTTPPFNVSSTDYPTETILGADMSDSEFTLFTDCRYILDGTLVQDHLVVSASTGLILKRDGYIGGDVEELDQNIIAPGYLELHTNGANGFHFTHFEDSESYATKLNNIADYYPSQGVTGFWATIPTVNASEFQQVRPSFMYCSISYSKFHKTLSHDCSPCPRAISLPNLERM